MTANIMEREITRPYMHCQSCPSRERRKFESERDQASISNYQFTENIEDRKTHYITHRDALSKIYTVGNLTVIITWFLPQINCKEGRKKRGEARQEMDRNLQIKRKYPQF